MADQAVRIGRCVAGGLGPRVWVVWAVAAFLAAMAPGAAVAQDGPDSGVRASLTADRAALTVGDPVTLTLEITHPPDHVVLVPRLGPEWGSFDVVSQTTAQTESNADGTETTGQRIEVTLFAPGTFETPDLSISIRGPDGGVERVFPLPVRLTVNSVLSGTDETLKDIRSPADLSPPLWRQPTALAVAGLAALVALLPAAYFLRRRLRRGGPGPSTTADTRMPWEAALQEIDHIKELNLPGDGSFKEHYAMIARVTQAYIRKMYLESPDRRDATEMTTAEFENAVGQSSLDRRNARLVIDLLYETDLVRFSSYAPGESHAYEALRRVRDIVEGTRPAPEEAARLQDARSQREATT